MKYIHITFLLVLAIILTGCFQKPVKTETKKEVTKVQEKIVVPAAEIKDGIYGVDLEKSTVEWSAAKIVGSAHQGEIAIKSGTFTVQNGKIAEGEIVVDMEKITETKNNESFLKHLASSDFFDVKRYPEARFDLASIEVDGDSFKTSGDMKIKGITNQVTFSSVVKNEQEKFSASAEFVIDRTLWDIQYGSGKFFQELGDKAIKDEIELKIKIVSE